MVFTRWRDYILNVGCLELGEVSLLRCDFFLFMMFIQAAALVTSIVRVSSTGTANGTTDSNVRNGAIPVRRIAVDRKFCASAVPFSFPPLFRTRGILNQRNLRIYTISKGSGQFKILNFEFYNVRKL